MPSFDGCPMQTWSGRVFLRAFGRIAPRIHRPGGDHHRRDRVGRQLGQVRGLRLVGRASRDQREPRMELSPCRCGLGGSLQRRRGHGRRGRVVPGARRDDRALPAGRVRAEQLRRRRMELVPYPLLARDPPRSSRPGRLPRYQRLGQRSLASGATRHRVLRRGQPRGQHGPRSASTAHVKSHTDHSCDYRKTVACSNQPGRSVAETSGFSDGAHQVRITTFDAGGQSASAAVTARFDNHAPAPRPGGGRRR